ncbi:MAG: amino acid ABC transporter permease [Deltaproteobacteria bacterium]|nr:MAG: amino acid ABC transporter permease [Deltaproteobacteria bacterium]
MTKKKTKITPLDLILSALILAALVYLSYRIKVGLNYKWNWQTIPQYLYRYDQESGKWVPNLIMQGLFTTLRLSIWGTVLATILGTIMGLCRISQVLFYRLLGRLYVELIRNMPPLVLIFIFYYFVSGQIMPVLGLDEFILAQSEATQWLCELLFAPPSFLSAFFSALVTLAIFEGAYIAEIVRAGIQSIDKGQWEAAHALGLSKWQQMRHIILPQAVQRILPPLAGQFISLIKDSSIVSVISIQELTFQGMELMAATYLTFEIWITVTLLYLVLTFTCSLAVQRLEVRMTRGRAW